MTQHNSRDIFKAPSMFVLTDICKQHSLGDAPSQTGTSGDRMGAQSLWSALCLSQAAALQEVATLEVQGSAQTVTILAATTRASDDYDDVVRALGPHWTLKFGEQAWMPECALVRSLRPLCRIAKATRGCRAAATTCS